MEFITGVIFTLHGLFWGGCLVVLIYLIAKRIQAKKDENFENRSN